jgi:hypothetical protein
VALAAFQALTILFDGKRLFAYRADQNVEKILGDHNSYSTPSTVAGRVDFHRKELVDFVRFGFVLSQQVWFAQLRQH